MIKKLRNSLLLVIVFLAACSSPEQIVPTPESKSLPTPIVLATLTSTTTTQPTVTPEKATPPSKETEAPFPKGRPTRQIVPVLKVASQKLFDDAQVRRESRRKSDPDFQLSVDVNLNQSLVNILLDGYGDSFEPPKTARSRVDSVTIVSINPQTSEVFVTSITHDVRCPECEMAKGVFGKKVSATRINDAYQIGGFTLLRRVFEHATGLSIDYALAFEDSVIKQAIDTLLGGSIKVVVPRDFRVSGFFFGNTFYREGEFKAGKTVLTGLQAIQFIKTVPQDEDPQIEHNVRKMLVIEAIAKKISSGGIDLGKAGDFLGGKISGQTKIDFEIETLPSILQALALAKTESDKHPGSFNLPKPEGQYIVDPAHDADANILPPAVQWVKANAAINPSTQRDIDSGIYSLPGQDAIDMEVPVDSSTNCQNLAFCYWKSVRERVRAFLERK